MKMLKNVVCLLLALVMVMLMTACNSEGSDISADGSPIIRWIAFDAGHPGRDEVEREVKRYVKEKIGVDLQITWVLESNQDSLSTIIASGEWDVANLDGNVFNSYVGRNAFYAIDEYVDTLAPTAKEVLPEGALEACMKNGKLYGLPAYKDLNETWGLLYNKDLFDEFDITVPEGYTTERDLVPMYYEMAEKYNKANPNNKNAVFKPSTYLNSWFQFDSLCGSWGSTLACTNIPGAEGFGTTDANTVFSPYFTDEYAEYVRTLWQMAKDDLIPSAPGDNEMRWGEGQGFCQISCGWIELDPHNFGSWNAGWYPADVAVSSTSTLQSATNVISAGCKNPEAALKFLELTYSDEYLCSVLKFGIEGKDWEDSDNDGVAEMLDRNADAGNRYWYMWYGARNSSIYKTKIAPGSSTRFLEKLSDLNAASVASIHSGFALDISPITNEIAACNNALAKYNSMLQYPAFDNPDQFVQDLRKELTDNGIERIIAEVQKQLDEWHAAQ